MCRAQGHIHLAFGIVLLCGIRATWADDRFDPLLKRLPAGANAVMAIDVEAAYGSAIAREQGWRRKHQTTYTERPLFLPPETALALMGSQLDSRNQLGQVWEVAILELTENLPLPAIAKAEGGQLDQIGDYPVVWAPAGAYFVELRPQLLALAAPDDRQFIGRWTANLKAGSANGISEYLTNAVHALSAPKPIVMAFDLAYVIQPHRLKANLQDSDALKDHQDQVPALTQLLAGLQGITLQIGLSDKAEGVLTVDFKVSAAPLGNLAKPLMIESLDLFDAHLPGLEKWTARIRGTQATLSGPLDQVALRRVFSLLQLPAERFSTEDSASAGQETSAAQAAAKSQAYYKSVATLIDDLKSTLGETRDNHAVWMERYGKKVDQLPLLGVDPALLDWGASVAETMRTMALAERSAAIRGGVRKSSVYGNYYMYNDYGNYGGDASVEKMYHTINMQERSQAKAVRFESWKEMEDATAKIRRAMTEKYQVEF